MISFRFTPFERPTSISNRSRWVSRSKKLDPFWPDIFDQLGREKFRSDVAQLSGKELELIHQFARLGAGELATHHFTGKFQTEYFARLAEKGLLIRTGRGRYKPYHPLFREFLRQTE